VENTPVNPWPWSLELGFNQAQLVEDHTCTLYMSGQTAVDGDGIPRHEGDLAGQINLALDNLETVLASAGMTLAEVVRLNIYTTDVDGLIENFDILKSRFAEAGATPPGSLLGVARLAFPELLVEFEATAAA
jgi:enamine deaminase RidA (YjgF/YER057c/UK114 family)